MQSIETMEATALPLVKPTILLVEDETLVRATIADELRIHDYVVIEAASGDEAAAIVRSSRGFDAVVTDLSMPGIIDGAMLVRMVRKEFPTMHIVMISAHKPGRELSDMLDGYLIKPFFPSLLVGYLNKLFAAAAN